MIARGPNTLCPLPTLGDVDAVLARSASRPAVILKHGSTCGVSSQAYEEVEALIAGPPLSADVYLVDVWADRAVSNAIATCLKIRHESPQVLLVDRGLVRWSASHFRVTASAIRTALADLPTTA